MWWQKNPSSNGIGSLRGSLSIRPGHLFGMDNLFQLLLGLSTCPPNAHVLAELPGRNASFELHV